ncbi:hypothetical protein [Cytobacillus purgationiresistens]|uniref:DUF1048 domain-containing protein n=1 Tax=Cytobacillus purgationiresistens TaxID=863449 RepID=A0ABU0AK54_9BACI|nr:hypothetical protein [Cytobacillus purgationiresistens]MDQ0270783.1 hypothetical protein [Cytobacillus purgationiresistens]
MEERIKDLDEWKDDLAECKEEWNSGSTKFVPYLIDLAEKEQKEIERLKKYEISHAELQLFAGYCLNDLFENGGSMCEEWKTFIKQTRDRMLELQDI